MLWYCRYVMPPWFGVDSSTRCHPRRNSSVELLISSPRRKPLCYQIVQRQKWIPDVRSGKKPTSKILSTKRNTSAGKWYYELRNLVHLFLGASIALRFYKTYNLDLLQTPFLNLLFHQFGTVQNLFLLQSTLFNNFQYCVALYGR